MRVNAIAVPHYDETHITIAISRVDVLESSEQEIFERAVNLLYEGVKSLNVTRRGRPPADVKAVARGYFEE